MSSDIMKDFDTIAPVKRIARIGGEEVDVSVFSTRATLKLIDMTDSPEKIHDLENGKNIESFCRGGCNCMSAFKSKDNRRLAHG